MEENEIKEMLTKTVKHYIYGEEENGDNMKKAAEVAASAAFNGAMSIKTAGMIKDMWICLYDNIVKEIEGSVRFSCMEDLYKWDSEQMEKLDLAGTMGYHVEGQDASTLETMRQSIVSIFSEADDANFSRTMKAMKKADTKPDENFLMVALDDIFLKEHTGNGEGILSSIDRADPSLLDRWMSGILSIACVKHPEGVFTNMKIVFTKRFLTSKTMIVTGICNVICRNMHKLLTLDRFWKTMEHDGFDLTPEDMLKCVLPALSADKFCLHFTGEGKGYMSCGVNPMLDKSCIYHLNDFKLLMKIFNELFMKDRDINTVFNAMKCAPKFYNKYMRKEKVLKGLILKLLKELKESPNPAETDDLMNAIKYTMSDDFSRFEEIVRASSENIVLPYEIDMEVLYKFFTNIINPSLKEGSILQYFVRELCAHDVWWHLMKYCILWAAMYSRMISMWKGIYEPDVKKYLLEHNSKYKDMAGSPFELLRTAVSEWYNAETNRRNTLKELEAMAVNELERLESIRKEKEIEMNNNRKEGYIKEGFKLASESGKIEKWVKEGITRIFFKTTNRDEIRSILSDMDELGLTSSRVRNIRNPAGVTRKFVTNGAEIYSDTILEGSVKSLLKPYVGVVARPEDMKMEEYLLDLAYDKVFFNLEWLDEAVVRASQGSISIKDIRYYSSIIRNKGIIGQVKTKKSKEKVFSLTPEGYCLYNIKKEHPEIPVTALRWEDYVGEYLTDKIGTDMILDIITEPVKDIDKMITGKSPKFLDKYYVTLI